MPAGYSGTPLPKKLGIKPGMRLIALAAPANYQTLLGTLPDGASLGSRVSAQPGLVHLFVTSADELKQQLTRLRATIADEVPIWVSWPKKASRVPTTVTEDVIREVALPLGLVDIKVCAVSEVWSGLKLVVRKELRQRAK